MQTTLEAFFRDAIDATPLQNMRDMMEGVQSLAIGVVGCIYVDAKVGVKCTCLGKMLMQLGHRWAEGAWNRFQDT
jgi:hypothetical protein